MITQLSAPTRILLAECRALAMQGQLETAINKLNASRNNFILVNTSKSYTQIEIECAAISLLKIELLHLDMKDEEAFEFLRSEILTRISFLPKDVELVVLQNKVEIERALLIFDDLKQFYRSYDERKLIGLKLWNPQTIVNAYEDAAKGEHYEALPAFWHELEATYQKGSWLFFRQAARRMSIEWLQLGFAQLAAYQAVVARDEKLIKNIGEHLLASRNTELIRFVTKKILSNANLNCHAKVASELFKTIADAIPDDQLGEIFNWLILRCNLVPEDFNDLSLSTVVWETVLMLRQRLNKEQAEMVVETAIIHQFWEEPNRLRKYLLKAVNASVPHLSPERLIDLAHKAMPAVTKKQNEVDYADALTLISHIAQRSEEAKKFIGDELYVENQTANFNLQIIAPVFNREIFPEDAERLANEIVMDISLQAQRVNPEDHVTSPMSYLTQFSAKNEVEKIVVYIYGLTPLYALLEYRKKLNPTTIEKLIIAMLQMINEPENVPANKVGLINGIITLADCITPEIAETIFEGLLLFAMGEEMPIPIFIQSMGDPNNQLNPYKLNVQTPEDVRSGALIALAEIEKNMPNIYGDRLTSILEKAITDPHPMIRKHAYLSARYINVFGDAAVTNLIMGTQDPDPEVARNAYIALAENENLQFTEATWNSLANAIALGFNSIHSNVRSAATYVVIKREAEWSQTGTAEKMNELKEAFANDICYSVRATALQNELKNEN